jgi:hypothetical protein
MSRFGVASVLLACVALAGPPRVGAQFGFGQNKIQYRGFDWRVLRGQHVDLYHYPEADELARVTLAYAEESYRVLERLFAHAVPRRIPFIVYASHADFEQTNILPFVPPEGLLGVTEFLKRRVALPFRGNYAEFRHTIRHELVHVFQLSLAEEMALRYPKLRQWGLPLWWTEGLAEYFSAGEDTRDEMVLRDLTIAGRLPGLGELALWYGGVVYPLGGAIHRFLAESYGEWRLVQMYRDRWKYETFEHAFATVYGRSLEQVSEEWQHWMRQRYFPAVVEGRPLALSALKVAELAIKPVVYRGPDDSASRVFYFSPGRGYAEIHGRRFGPSGVGRARTVVKGERTEEFESFHYFASRLDVSPDGVVAFSSKYFDRDALFLWNLDQNRVVGRYQFEGIVSILSPAWAPDGQSVVFSGLSIAGFSDLYRVWFPDGRLERLTHDRYEDLDPSFSPDGRSLVFASDRTVFGADGARNLFRLDLASGAVDYLTYGAWDDGSPRWSAADGLIYFASDRDGTFQLYAIDSTGTGRQITRTTNGAFDPQWVPEEEGVLFGGFADLTFNIYFQRPARDTTLPAIALAPGRDPPQWEWAELSVAAAQATADPYRMKFSLDFAAGDVAVAPGIGSAQGAVFLFSDMIGDHLLFFGLSSYQGDNLGNVLDNLSGAAFYLNQSRRINWGVGAFRVSGTFYELDLLSQYRETAWGGFGQIRYPLSRYKRIEGELRFEHSDRRDLFGTVAAEPEREAWLASNYLSYVQDNTLWLTTGPIDGLRYTVTGGLTNDLSHGRFDSWQLWGDARRYLRTSLRSAVAARVIGYWAGGERPRRVNIGGTWFLRGYPRYYYVVGTRAWLVNLEWRFPLTNYLTIGFPFGPARFPGIQGALFADLGRAWSASSHDRGTLGSTGLGFRFPIASPLVLRLDWGWRFRIGEWSGYGLPPAFRRARFTDFFFGFNY